jgi:DNA-binding transcriptional ArsR family regulator
MAVGQQAASPEPAPRVARDVMAFGQETGRALSDGRIVGRAEPFTKVFPSSRAIKRAVGAMAWAVLEDIALEARIDDAGRLAAETNVRRIAENLAANKDTVGRHLARLREHGFVF